jgi:hypothetical protein
MVVGGIVAQKAGMFSHKYMCNLEGAKSTNLVVDGMAALYHGREGIQGVAITRTVTLQINYTGVHVSMQLLFAFEIESRISINQPS